MGERLGEEAVRLALAEDHADHDITTDLLEPRADAPATGTFVVEQPAVVAGLPVAAEVFRQLGLPDGLGTLVDDGAAVGDGTPVARVHGPARILLAGERTALNFLQRLSGIATATRRAVEAVAGTGAVITDTRKTAPGLRALEKYAVRMGGGENHRMHLADQVLWKDNHWALLDGPLGERLRAVPAGTPVVVEVETDEQLDAALDAGVRRILVDNITPETLAGWRRRTGASVRFEASGGITADTARAWAEAGADFISIGALTHSAPSVAIRMDIVQNS